MWFVYESHDLISVCTEWLRLDLELDSVLGSEYDAWCVQIFKLIDNRSRTYINFIHIHYIPLTVSSISISVYWSIFIKNIYTHTHIHIYTYIYTYAYIYTQTYTYTYTHIHTHTYTYIHMNESWFTWHHLYGKVWARKVVIWGLFWWKK